MDILARLPVLLRACPRWTTLLVGVLILGASGASQTAAQAPAPEILPVPAQAQETPAVAIPLMVSTDAGANQDLTVGLDPNATTGIDTTLGETEQPPLPPSNLFDARLIDDDLDGVDLGLGVLVDVRPGPETFSGTKMHEIGIQPGDSASAITVAWSLPDRATGTLEDVATGGSVVSASMAGTDSVRYDNLNITKLTVTITYSAPPSDDEPPTIGAVSDLTIPEDSTTGALPFTVDDPDTPLADLSVTAASSDPSVVPETGITIEGTGGDRTVTVTPALNATGASTVTLTVSDGTSTASTTFRVTVTPVNDPPTIGSITDVTIPEDSTTGPISVSLSDPDTPADSLSLTAASSDTALVPPAGLALDGTGLNRTLAVTPAPNAFGSATVTLTASDGQAETQTTFAVTVTPVNDAPGVRVSLPDDTLGVADPPLTLTGVGTILFRDPEGDPLDVSARASDTTVATAAIEGGPTLRVTPQTVGTTTVTLTASDGADSTSVAFALTVVESDPDVEPPSEIASAVIDSTGADSTDVDFGSTGTEATLRGVRTGGTIDVRFFRGTGGGTGGTAAATTRDGAVPAFVPGEVFASVSPYRWVVQTEGVTFDSVDVRFRLSDTDVVGIGDPSAVTIIQDANGDGDFDAVRTAFSDRGTPADSTDDVLVAQGLTDLGTFRFASDSDQNPLPVELASFTATRDAQAAVLSWRTASETNNAGFEVQHQTPDASGFREVGFVEGAGTTQEPQSYRFRADGLAPGTHRFRLRQVDVDGTATLTDPVTVTIEAERVLSLQATGPNPVRQSTQFAFTVQQSGPAEVTLYNVLGQRVRTLYTEETSAGQRHTVTVTTTDLPSGTYFVRLAAPSGTRTQRIVVVR